MRYVLSVALLSISTFAQVPTRFQIPRQPPKPEPAKETPKAEAPAPKETAPAAGATGGRGVLPKDLKYPPLRSIQPPAFTSSTLPNGMKLMLLEDHELPIVSGLAMVHAGTAMDPPDRIGLAATVGTLLRAGGTNAKTPDQLDNLLESMAASIESASDESGTKISFSTLKENLGTVLDVFREVLTQPEFRPDRVETARAQLRSSIASRNEDGAAIAQRELAGLIYGRENPYGWITQYATVDRIARKEAREYYARYFYPANTTLGIWGDFDSAQMKAAVEKEFAEWNVPAQPAPAPPKTPDPAAGGIYVAEKKEGTQTFFAAGQLAGKASDKDLAALQVAAAILGSGPKGRIPEKARARTGAPHEIRAVWRAAYDHAGLFEISGTTRNVTTTDVIRIVREEVQLIGTAEVTDQELNAARELLLNGMVFAYDTRAKLLARQMQLDFAGYPQDYLPQYQKAVQAVTRADVLRVAKQYLPADKLAIVVVGNPVMFAEPLEKLGGTVNRLDIGIPEPRVEPVVTTDATLAEGRALLQKAQAVMGGVQKLLAVKDYTQTGTYAIDPVVPNIGGAKVTEIDKWLAPTIFRQDSVLPAGRVAAYTDGRLGWISTPQGWGGLVGTQLKQVQGDLFRTWFRLMLSDLVEGRTVNAVDGTTIQISDAAGMECKVEFDSQSGLPRRVTYDTAQAIGAPLYTEDIFEDFREVEGIKLPFKITINQGGRKFADVSVKEYQLNSGLKQVELSRRPM
jgi:zinc protease